MADTPQSDGAHHERPGMSALPPKADMCSAIADVRYGPKADIANLLDHLVGASDQRRRNRETKCLGGLGVDSQLGICRKFHRKVAGLLALENPGDIYTGPAVSVGLTCSIAN